MGTWIKTHRSLFIRIIILLLIIAFFVTLIILKSNPVVCEEWSRGFSRWYVTVFGTLTKYIPFSLTEWIVVGAVVACIVLLVLAIINFVKKKGYKGTSKLINICLIVMAFVTLYQATAEMNYNRSALPIAQYNGKVEKSEYRGIMNYFIDDLNYCVSQLEYDENDEICTPYPLEEIWEKLEKEYARLDDAYFTPFTGRVKPMVTSFLYREMHITGLTFQPLGEASINYLNVAAEKPMTYAHELAHLKGVMREQDANVTAAYVLLTSDDPYFRYSAYYYTLPSLLTLDEYLTKDAELYASTPLHKIDWQFYENVIYNMNYWDAHRFIVDIAEFFNNLYLKSSGEEKGTESYNDTPEEVDPETEEVIVYSTYQRMYFDLYFNKRTTF